MHRRTSGDRLRNLEARPDLTRGGFKTVVRPPICQGLTLILVLCVLSSSCTDPFSNVAPADCLSTPGITPGQSVFLQGGWCPHSPSSAYCPRPTPPIGVGQSSSSYSTTSPEETSRRPEPQELQGRSCEGVKTMAASKPNLERMKEASATHNYALAAESFTRAIDAGLATAGLYADRALALIMLGSYVEAIDDANKCIHLDPSMARGYTRKGAALMKLKQYRAAKKVLELGSSCTSDKSKFVWFLEKCKKFIAEEPNQSQDAPVSLIKPKYSHYYYNKGTKVILAICAMGVPADSITVHFGEQMLNVSIDIPGEERYQFHSRLPSKIVPERCSYQILPNEVIIHLEKADQRCWQKLLPQSRCPPNCS